MLKALNADLSTRRPPVTKYCLLLQPCLQLIAWRLYKYCQARWTLSMKTCHIMQVLNDRFPTDKDVKLKWATKAYFDKPRGNIERPGQKRLQCFKVRLCWVKIVWVQYLPPALRISSSPTVQNRIAKLLLHKTPGWRARPNNICINVVVLLGSIGAYVPLKYWM